MLDQQCSDLSQIAVDSPLIESVQRTLSEQGQALTTLSQQLDAGQYAVALKMMLECKGHVILSGMGKSGHVGRKMSATMASTGTPSFFIHPAEAFHGDLGMITPYDLLILISASGETDEILKLIPSLKNFGNRIVAITNNGQSTLAKHADAVLELHMASEACPNNLAPTTSTTLTMAIGDALAIALMEKRHFRSDDFARYHPGGSLGRRLLTRVSDVMSDQVPTIDASADFKQVIQAISGGCQGMVAVTEQNRLVGIITDGDLRRFMEKTENFLQTTAISMMTRQPLTISPAMMVAEAEAIMQKRRVSSLLVTENDNIVGLLRIFN
ncbi:KpsF/GutQ family sugar-phosphate isomerase [Atlantibacter hermannii]|uniref:Arabinose 5-phosphate isomerase n=1 Tax=Atlantibacter hermannii NBRC 105704 TaxID=1115512 RepID=H5UZQ2_ATLHE|nr:KpsF/GutQ family sugar-phosphate isomerase [Atlantibacter hermannii]MCQ4966494.1 KpsF/GutQ family sugar-phosphate isomerase [Enterobacteriaceae bacterium DFI.7.85]MDU7814718.1 KpsF/GutQ family sugar-phosphate isomerase [Atlantibacter hermannii]QPS92381.1 KpsF/GutQ family sugar-phosphate isomerase [Atlantibacter hermannii]VDZ75102.1 polysialic acid capsule synthesis protein KpsF [Atlantibacter hermannii]GAB51210.1 arabinose-5-phosphate isomerase KdsD [Atlantibacter hermannii NBRC 105704]